jgi:cytochrome c
LRLAFAALLLLAPAVAQAQDAKRGQLLFLQCRACHNLKAGEPHKVGPNLHGFLAKPAASMDGFKYSKALVASKLKWDDATLDRWLEAPAKLVPGTTMAFAGVRKPEDRAALIAHLRQATK